MHCIHYALYTLYTVYTMHCIHYTMHYIHTLYTVHFTLSPLFNILPVPDRSSQIIGKEHTTKYSCVEATLTRTGIVFFFAITTKTF